MVFVCVIWSFDDMGLGKQVILSDKVNRETKQNINIGKVIIFLKIERWEDVLCQRLQIMLFYFKKHSGHQE